MDPIYQGLLAGTGFGHTAADYTQQQQQIQAAPLQQVAQQLQVVGAVQQLKHQQVQQQRLQAFQTASSDYAQNPTPEKTLALAAQFPEQADNLTKLWGIKKDAQKQADLTLFGGALAAAQAGKTDLALQQITARRDAEKSAGQDTTELDQLIANVQQAGPDAVNVIKSVALPHIFASDPAGFAKSMGLSGDDYSISDGVVINKRTGQVGQDLRKPEYKTIKGPDGQEHLVKINPTPLNTGSGPAASGSAGGGFKGFYDGWLAKTEGGYADRDGLSGAPVNFGVNQKANPDIDVKSLTPEKAQAVLYNRYWKPSGAEALAKTNPALAEVVGDTAVNMGVDASKRLLQESGGDASKYLDLREARYRSIAASNPAQQANLGSWLNRNNALRQRIGVQDGAAQPGQPDQGGQIQDVTPGGMQGGSANIAVGDISTVPASMRSAVQAISDGRIAPPRPGSRNGEALLEAVTAYDPKFDYSVAPERMKARDAFTGNGKAAQVASSGNRLAYHMNDLYKDSQALSGPDLGFAPLSNLATGIGQSFQQAAVARYKTVLPFISGELQKLTKNGTATEGETNRIIHDLRPDQPTNVRNAAIQQVVELAQGQFKPFRNQWESAFGADKTPPVDFTPTTQKIFDRITNGGEPLQVDHNGNEVGAMQNKPPLAVGTTLPGGFKVVGVRPKNG